MQRDYTDIAAVNAVVLESVDVVASPIALVNHFGVVWILEMYQLLVHWEGIVQQPLADV